MSVIARVAYMLNIDRQVTFMPELQIEAFNDTDYFKVVHDNHKKYLADTMVTHIRFLTDNETNNTELFDFTKYPSETSYLSILHIILHESLHCAGAVDVVNNDFFYYEKASINGITSGSCEEWRTFVQDDEQNVLIVADCLAYFIDNII